MVDMKVFESSDQVQVSYDIYGDSESKQAILFFHGFPGSHLQGSFLNQKLKDLNQVMVAVDRPGYGNSSWINPKEWDLATQAYSQLMTSLGFDKITIMGVSGGSPMAHMTASRLNERVLQLIVVCGLASFSKLNRPSFSINQKRLLDLAKLIPTTFLKIILNKGLSSFKPEKRLQHLIQTLHESDREVLAAPKNQDLLLQSMKWARNQGSHGIVWDSQIFCQDWLHQFCDLTHFKKFSTIYYHGENDFLLSPTMSLLMHQSVSQSTYRLIKNQGHYSLPLMEQNRIFEELRQF